MDLSNAAWAGDLQRVKELVAQGADIHTNDDEPLRWAAEGGHTDIVALLLDKGARIHSVKGFALEASCRNGHAKTAALLLARGANPNVSNHSAFLAAASNGQSEIVGLLLCARGPRGAGGAKISPPLNTLNEALALTQIYGHKNTADLIIAAQKKAKRAAAMRAMREEPACLSI